MTQQDPRAPRLFACPACGAAPVEASEQHHSLYALFMQTPIPMAILRGPEHVVEFQNAAFRAFAGDQDHTGLPIHVARPDLVERGYVAQLDRVAVTGESVNIEATLIRVRGADGALREAYFTQRFEPWRDTNGHVIGIINICIDVTEQVRSRDALQKTEAQLRANEERLRLALGAAAMGTYDWSLARGTLLWSDETARLHGIEPEDFNSTFEHARNLTDPVDHARIMQEIAGIAQHGGQYEVEYRTVPADGGPRRCLRSFGRIIVDADGRPMRSVGVVRDITAEKQMQANIAQTAERFREMYLQTPAAVAVMMGPQLHIAHCNHGFFELVGDRHVEGKPVQEALPEMDAALLSVMNDVYRSGFPFIGSAHPATWRHDEIRGQAYFDLLIYPLLDTAGVIEGISLFVYDVTDMVLARKVIEDQQKWLESVLDLLPIPLMLVDPDSTRLQFANKAADKLGASALVGEATLDDAGNSLTMTDEYDVPLSMDQLPALRAARGEAIDNMAVVLHTAEGRVSVICNARLLASMYGHAATVAVTLHDVSELKRIEDALRQAVVARDEFLSIASHELKTPLTPLKMQVQNMRRILQRGDIEKLTPERLQRMADVTDRQITRLAGLIDDLLDVSNIAAGRAILHCEPVDLGTLVREVVERFAPQFAAASCQLRLRVRRNIVGDWDPLRLEQVLSNLLTNAIKYAPGQPVDIVLTRRRDTACLQVRDHGTGIAAHDIPRIFERFERVSSCLTISGMGLGLFITRQIVEAHGGRIDVKSTVGVGTTFTVILPFQPSAPGVVPIGSPVRLQTASTTARTTV